MLVNNDTRSSRNKTKKAYQNEHKNLRIPTLVLNIVSFLLNSPLKNSIYGEGVRDHKFNIISFVPSSYLPEFKVSDCNKAKVRH